MKEEIFENEVVDETIADALLDSSSKTDSSRSVPLVYSTCTTCIIHYRYTIPLRTRSLKS